MFSLIVTYIYLNFLKLSLEDVISDILSLNFQGGTIQIPQSRVKYGSFFWRFCIRKSGRHINIKWLQNTNNN